FTARRGRGGHERPLHRGLRAHHRPVVRRLAGRWWLTPPEGRCRTSAARRAEPAPPGLPLRPVAARTPEVRCRTTTFRRSTPSTASTIGSCASPPCSTTWPSAGSWRGPPALYAEHMQFSVLVETRLREGVA